MQLAVLLDNVLLDDGVEGRVALCVQLGILCNVHIGELGSRKRGAYSVQSLLIQEGRLFVDDLILGRASLPQAGLTRLATDVDGAYTAAVQRGDGAACTILADGVLLSV